MQREGESVLNPNPASGLRVLNFVRWWLCATGLFMAVSVIPETRANYHKWHAALPSDFSTAAFWRTTFYLDLLRIAIELALVVAIFIVLKPRARGSEPAGR